MLCIQVSGNAEEQGFQYGLQAGELVRRNAETYRKLLQDIGYNVRDLAEAGLKYRTAIHQYAPDYLDFIDNLALASKTSSNDLIVMTARSELISLSGCWSPTECTSLALDATRTVGFVPLVAQNWDWLHEMQGSQIVLKVNRKEKPSYVSFCEAGQWAKISVNDRGLAVGINFLNPPVEKMRSAQQALPVHVLLHCILDASTVSEAVQILNKLPCAGGVHLMLADSTGRIASVEISPDKVVVLHSQILLSGVLTHANDYEEGAGKPVRSQRLRNLTDRTVTYSIEDVFALLTDHDGVEPICSHPRGAGSSASLASLVLDPSLGHMWVREGRPCTEPQLACAYAKAIPVRVPIVAV